ncbi:Uma2 family endonuclease [Streptomyces sp. NPDC049555]|uniref:Uma2 family endonuclease n=1 Tax=Streptomyces sp. NPDC049555 TaxID=3154930 RepID=UPI0034300C11
MTPTPRTPGRPQVAVEDFEELARRAPEAIRLELIGGEVRVKPMPDGNHDEIIMWLLMQCMQQRPDLALYPERGLKVEAYRKGRARTDGALAPRKHFAGQGEWADPDGVLMTVEITSHDFDTERRDRIEKPDGYAAAGIPVFLLVDRDRWEVTVHTEPAKGKYCHVATHSFGARVEIPAPVGIVLETEELKEFAD